MDKKKFALDSLSESAETKIKIQHECVSDIIAAVDLISDIYKKGKKLLLCGNGGVPPTASI